MSMYRMWKAIRESKGHREVKQSWGWSKSHKGGECSPHLLYIHPHSSCKRPFTLTPPTKHWRVILLLHCDVRDIFPCSRVIRGSLCDNEMTSQLGRSLLQDQQLFLVVNHFVSINEKSSLFSYIWCYGFIYLNTMLIYWIKLLDDAT